MSGILYSAIARKGTLLVSSQNELGTFDSVVLNILPNILTERNTKTSYTSESHMYHILVEDGLIYICATACDYGRRIPYAYLLEIKRRFTSCSLVARANVAAQHELDRDFAHVMQEQMEIFSRDGSGDQINKLQTQVDEVMGVMTENIEKVVDRGERLESLLDKTNELEASSSRFRVTARAVRRKMLCKNVKMWIILSCVIAVILTIIILFATNVIPVKG